ncbi:MAG TPA: carboxypeptidase-like regulatory domain-containing protein [Planctomycetota bacterium]|nr:carboxypeptidase-like regulatory domain-containing protein [Planctomycetota bacterium]
MSRREPLLVALLLLGSVTGVVFVFTSLRAPGRSWTSNDTPREAPLPRAPSPRPSGAEATAPEAPTEDEDRPPAPARPASAPEDATGGEAGEPSEKGDESEDKPIEGAADLVLELMPPADPTDRTVHVHVMDGGGNPVARALVVVREGTEILFRARTDASGLAEFPPYDEEKGPFRIDALAHGFVAGNAPSVAPGADTDLILEYRPIVEGKVRGAEGRRGVVRLFQGSEERSQPLAPDGTFVFEDLDPGETAVQAEVDVYGVDTETFFLEGGTRRYVSMRIKTNNAATIQGTVEAWPGSGSMTINGLPVTVRPSGGYTFEHAVVGLNEVLIDAPGKALLRDRFEVKTLQMSFYPFRLQREGTVRGRVRKMFSNDGVPGAEVRIGFDRGDPKNDRVPLFPIDRVPVVTTDQDGRFEVTRLDKRLTYLLSIVAPGYGQYFGPVMPDGGHLTAKMPEGPFVFGRLRGVGGTPTAAVVTATPLEGLPVGRLFNKEGWDRARTERDREGLYGLSGLLPGPYLVRVDAPGFGSIETVMDLHDGERIRMDLRVRRGIEVDRDEEALLRRLPPIEYEGEGAPGAGATLLKIDARRPSHEQQFPGLRVRFFDGEKEFAPPMDFDDAQIDLVGLPEATYRAILSHPALPRPIVRDNIVVRRGAPVEVEMR